MTDNTFQLSGFVFPGVNEDPFGMWDVVPATSGVSFGVGEAAAAGRAAPSCQFHYTG